MIWSYGGGGGGKYGVGGDNYFIEMAYFSATSLVVRAMPRLQNQWTLVAVNVVDGTTRNIRTQTHAQWLEPSGTNYTPLHIMT